MSYWQHAVCENCWNEMNPTRPPFRVMNLSEEKTCCFCGKRHNSGIFLRMAGDVIKCQGKCDN